MSGQRLMLLTLIVGLLLFAVACGDASEGDDAAAGPAGSQEAVAPAEVGEAGVESEPAAAAEPVDTVDEPVEIESPAEPATEAAEQSQAAVVEPSDLAAPGAGEIIADTGFRPEVNGFSFANFGDDVKLIDEPSGTVDWQTEFLVQDLFDEQAVCARIEDDTCIPTPAARLWIDVVNRAKAGGHCEGFAALSAELFTGIVPLQDFGVATASELKLSYDTLDLISLEWMVQAIEPVASETAKFRAMTPTEILDVLHTTMNDGSDFFTMGLYGPNGGHSVTPYAIEELGQGLFLVYVYDSNYPGAGKYVEIDTNDDTWRYAGGALDPADDPAPWEGGQGSLDLTSTQVRFESFECPFCARSGDSLANKILVLLNGKGGRVSAINDQNKRVAMGAGNSEVNEIPGSKVVRLKGNGLYNDDRNWLMILPADKYKISVTGATNEIAEPTQVAIFQPGRSYVVDDINLDPGQEDELFVTDEGQFSYTAGDDETPTLAFATDELDDIDGMFVVSGAELSAGYSFTVGIDETTDRFAFFEDDPDLETFDLAGYTVDATGAEDPFSFDDVMSGDESLAIFELEDDGDFMSLGLDDDLDGEIDISDADGDGILDPNEPDSDSDGVIDDLEACDYDPENDIPDCADMLLPEDEEGDSADDGAGVDENETVVDEEPVDEEPVSDDQGEPIEEEETQDDSNVDDQGGDESNAGDDSGDGGEGNDF